MRRLPWLSLLIAGAAALVHALPAFGERLVYDRALVDDGQWWRLTTAHLVHFGWSHWGFDALALLIAGALAERRGRLAFGAACGAAVLAAGLAVHRFSPELARYAGLSAVAYAAFVHAILVGVRDEARYRVAWLALLGGLVIKLALEQLSGRPAFWNPADGTRVASLSHVAGALAAGAAFVLAWAARRMRRAAGAPAARRPVVRQAAAARDLTSGITCSENRSISSSWGENWSSIRSIPASSNARIRSATCCGVPTRPARSPRLETE